MNILLYDLYVNSYDKVWAKICDLIKWKYLFNHMACEGTYLFSEFGKLMFQGRGYTPIKFDVLSSIEIPLVQFFLFFYHFTYLFHLFIYLKLVYSRTLAVLPNFWSSWDVPAFSILWKQRYIKENHENNMPIKIYLPSYHWPGDPKKLSCLTILENSGDNVHKSCLEAVHLEFLLGWGGMEVRNPAYQVGSRFLTCLQYMWDKSNIKLWV